MNQDQIEKNMNIVWKNSSRKEWNIKFFTTKKSKRQEMKKIMKNKWRKTLMANHTDFFFYSGEQWHFVYGCLWEKKTELNDCIQCLTRMTNNTNIQKKPTKWLKKMAA